MVDSMSNNHSISSSAGKIRDFTDALRQNDLVAASYILVNLNTHRDDFADDLEERLSQLEGVYLTLVKAKLLKEARG